jgi:hypothetical protein
MLRPKYGGYVFEDGGLTWLVCADNLCFTTKEKSKKPQKPPSTIKLRA